jgi:hypothetical protein
MFEIRPHKRPIPGQKNETPACEAGESKTANNKEVSAIVAGRAPCAGIVPRDLDAHLADLRRQAAGVDANHAANVREHKFCARSMAAIIGAELAGEVQP